MSNTNNWSNHIVIFLIISMCITLNGCKYVSGMEGDYSIVAPVSGEVISVGHSSNTISMQAMSDTIAMHQAWTLQNAGEKGLYRIISMLSEKAITIDDDGRSIYLSDISENDVQLFRVMVHQYPTTKNHYAIVSLAFDGVLTVTNEIDTAGDLEVTLEKYNKEMTQGWRLSMLTEQPDEPDTSSESIVENYAVEFSSMKYSTGTNKKLCGYSVSYPNGKGSIKKYRYQNYLEQFSGDVTDWSRGKFGYSKVSTASQAVMPDNTTRSKAILISAAKRGRSLGACNLNVFKGAFSGSNAPSRNQANCGGSSLSKYCLRHEAGHTWGLAHDGIHNQDTCEKTDSGISQMSGFKTGFNIPHLHWLGWVEEDQVKQLQWDNSNGENYIFGDHWVAIRPLAVSDSDTEDENPYGLVIDLRRSGNRLWLASNQEGRLLQPSNPEYNKREDALVAMLSAPFETAGFSGGHRWKGTSIYRFIDENRPWDDKLMDDIIIRVVERTENAMLVRIEPSVTDNSCSELPNASYVITKNNTSINSIEKLGSDNLNMEFQFKTEYVNRDSLCSKSTCDLRQVSVNNLWDTCYFEHDSEKTNLLQNGKVKISSGGQCRSKQTFKTTFSKSDKSVYADKFSQNIVCKAAYQCFYKVGDSIKFPVYGSKQVNVDQNVAIETIYPNDWKSIISKKRQGESWDSGPY